MSFLPMMFMPMIYFINMNTIGIDFGTGNTVLAEWYGTQSKIYEQIGNNGLVCSDIAIGKQGQIIPQPVNNLQNLSDYKIEKLED